MPHEIIPVDDAHNLTQQHQKFQSGLEQMIALAVNAVTSENSRRNYELALRNFLEWATYEDDGGECHIRDLNKALINEYKAHLQATTSPRTGKPLSPSTINLKLSAIRKLVHEAADNDLIEQVHANGIAAVKGVTAGGVRAGNWLTREQAQALLNAPDPTTLKGLRDRAILAVMILAGLRRHEVACLTVEHIQQRDGRWAIVDIVGKRNKVRTVPIKPLVKVLLDEWTNAAEITDGPIWRGFRKGNHILSEPGISSQVVWRVVEDYALPTLGFRIAPHDLRRTYAKLAHKGGAAIEQISLNLGHGSVTTTEKYLGVDLDMEHAPSDFIDVTLEP
jgi:site-specific recombinase XerD